MQAENVALFEELYNKGMNDKEISEQLGIDVGIVTSWRRLNHLRLKRKAKLTAVGVHDIEEERKYYLMKESMYNNLYHMGYNDEAIAYLCDVTKGTVKNWRRRNGLPVTHILTLIAAKRQVKNYRIELAESEEPSDDPESLFGSTKILEEICSKDLD